jgi:phosphate transport system substrate-binding protein
MISRLLLLVCALCLPGSLAAQDVIRISGSDTMVQVMQQCAEAYWKKNPQVRLEVMGGRTGVGLAGLANQTTDLAMAARPIEAAEAQKIEQRTGHEAVPAILAFEALAVIVPAASPVEGMSIPQLREIFGEGGEITRWEQLNVDGAKGEIVLAGRSNNSAIHHFFRTAVLGVDAQKKPKEFRKGMPSYARPEDVADLVVNTPAAIGYAPPGYVREEKRVKILAIAADKDGGQVMPTEENIRGKKYPLAREMYLYSEGKPQGDLAEFVKWLTGPEGQEIVKKAGFVPVKK